RGHHDHRHLGMLFLHLLQQLEPRHARHADVGDEHLGRLAGKRVERIARGGEGVVRDALAGQRLLHDPADRAVVVDYPDLCHVSGSRIVNTVRPGLDSNSTTPRWYWMNVCASESPSPLPPSLPDTSGLKMRSWIACGTPGPSSTTCNSSASL